MKNILQHITRSPQAIQAKTGFTLVEVIVATIIFLLAAAGLFATISALGKPSSVSEREMRAAMIAKSIIHDLRKEVDSDTWNFGNLQAGATYSAPVTPLFSAEIPYYATYTVEADPLGSRARRVTVNVTWEE